MPVRVDVTKHSEDISSKKRQELCEKEADRGTYDASLLDNGMIRGFLLLNKMATLKSGSERNLDLTVRGRKLLEILSDPKATPKAQAVESDVTA